MLREMADWMHCNVCFKQPEPGGTGFLLTSCGHILCHICIQQFTEKCTSCGNCKSMTISEEMQPENLIYFQDPDEIIKKEIKAILQVMDFQKHNRKKLFTYFRKHLNMERTCQELADKVQQYEREMLMLKKENAELKNVIKMAKVPQSPFGNSAATGLRSNLYLPAEQPMMVSPSGLGLTSPYVLKRRYPSNMSEAMDCRTSNTMHPNYSSVFTPPLRPSGHNGPLQLSGRIPPAYRKRYTPTLAGIHGVAGRTIYRSGYHSAPPVRKETPGKSALRYFTTSPMNKQDPYKRMQGASSLSSDPNAAGSQTRRQIQLNFTPREGIYKNNFGYKTPKM